MEVVLVSVFMGLSLALFARKGSLGKRSLVVMGICVLNIGRF